MQDLRQQHTPNDQYPPTCMQYPDATGTHRVVRLKVERLLQTHTTKEHIGNEPRPPREPARQQCTHLSARERLEPTRTRRRRGHGHERSDTHEYQYLVSQWSLLARSPRSPRGERTLIWICMLPERVFHFWVFFSAMPLVGKTCGVMRQTRLRERCVSGLRNTRLERLPQLYFCFLCQAIRHIDRQSVREPLARTAAAMFSLFMGLWSYWFSKAELHLLIVGLDDAGKTVRALVVRPTESWRSEERRRLVNSRSHAAIVLARRCWSSLRVSSVANRGSRWTRSLPRSASTVRSSSRVFSTCCGSRVCSLCRTGSSRARGHQAVAGHLLGPRRPGERYECIYLFVRV